MGLDLGVDDLAVVDDHAVAVGALALDPGVLLGEGSAVVGGEDDGLVLDAVGLAPAGHDEGVVVGQANDLVDALGLELGELGDVAGDVAGRAGGGEGAGEGEEDDLLVLELLAGVVLDGHAASRELRGLGGGRDVGEGNTLGEVVASLERSHCDLFGFG